MKSAKKQPKKQTNISSFFAVKPKSAQDSEPKTVSAATAAANGSSLAENAKENLVADRAFPSPRDEPPVKRAKHAQPAEDLTEDLSPGSPRQQLPKVDGSLAEALEDGEIPMDIDASAELDWTELDGSTSGPSEAGPSSGPVPRSAIPHRDPDMHQRFQNKLVVGRGNYKRGSSEAQEAQRTQLASSSGAKPKYTPLELQVVDLKRRYPGVLLIVEVVRTHSRGS